jgi:hypothetical protein
MKQIIRKIALLLMLLSGLTISLRQGAVQLAGIKLQACIDDPNNLDGFYLQGSQDYGDNGIDYLNDTNPLPSDDSGLDVPTITDLTDDGLNDYLNNQNKHWDDGSSSDDNNNAIDNSDLYDQNNTDNTDNTDNYDGQDFCTEFPDLCSGNEDINENDGYVDDPTTAINSLLSNIVLTIAQIKTVRSYIAQLTDIGMKPT